MLIGGLPKSPSGQNRAQVFRQARERNPNDVLAAEDIAAHIRQGIEKITQETGKRHYLLAWWIRVSRDGAHLMFTTSEKQLDTIGYVHSIAL